MRRWQQSQLSVRAYCARQQLSEPSFYAWKRTLQQRGLLPKAANANSHTPIFVPVSLPQSNPIAAPLELVLPTGLTVRVAAGFDADTLRQLLALLREQPC